jgi:hypothetical protein
MSITYFSVSLAKCSHTESYENLSSVQAYMEQFNNSVQFNSTQFNSTQFNSIRVYLRADLTAQRQLQS